MKTRFLIIMVFLGCLTIGCKNEKADQESSDSKKELVVDTGFAVNLEMLVKKDDNFQLYYIEEPGENFSEEKSIWVEVKGMETTQKITFNLPIDIVPELIRLDFGVNEKQEDITLLNFEMDFKGETFKTSGTAISTYFRALDGENGTQMDFNTGIIKAITKEGKRVEPVLYPNEVALAEEISKLVK